MTKNKGRGLFASRLLRKGELIIAEKAIACDQNTSGDNKKMLEICSDIMQYKGINALRLSLLSDGSNENLEIPSIDIYTKNEYKSHKIPDLDITKLA